jgi:hypothetical protein
VFSLRHASMNSGLALGALVVAAIASVGHPGTFTAIYVADAVAFLAFVPVLAGLRIPGSPTGQAQPTDASAGSGTPACSPSWSWPVC